MNAEKYVGKQYGKLVVINYSHEDKHRQKYWLCKCECGNEKTINIARLKSGKTKSCGCLRADPDIRSVINKKRSENVTEETLKKVHYKTLYGSHKRRHEPRWPNDTMISYDAFVKTIHMPCHYCGAEKSNFYHSCYRSDGTARIHAEKQKSYIAHSSSGISYNGLDRIDSKQGYIEGNVFPCCKRCNGMKNKYSINEFVNHIKKILEHLGEKYDAT
jgi:hypothetical protein